MEISTEILLQRIEDLEGQMQQVRDGTLGWETNVKARAYLSATQSNIAKTTWVKVTLDIDSGTGGYDLGNNFNTTLNRFIAPVSGYYQVNAQATFSQTDAGKLTRLIIYKNGVANHPYNYGNPEGANYYGVTLSDVIYLARGNYIELYVYSDNAADTMDIIGTRPYTYMSIHLLSKDYGNY